MPDDTVMPRSSFNVFYHAIFDDVGFGNTLQTWGGNYGILRDVEIGFAGLTNIASSGSDIAVNGKWAAIPERANRPGVAIGVFDVFDQFRGPSTYFSLGKDLGPLIQGMGGPYVPIRISAGVGNGVFEHGFIGANWTAFKNFQLMAEYVGTDLAPESGGNLGIRYAIIPGLVVDGGLLDFQNFSIGLSYSTRIK
jgi:hypothetical protein